MKVYTVKEIYYTLQGEGAHAGRPSVFLRFTGCNLWSGRESDRTNAICTFCDTDFVGTDGPNGGKYRSPEILAEKAALIWEHGAGIPPSHCRPGWLVCTGGEPLLQLDVHLIDALHSRGFLVAIETNGTLPVPEGVDWVCVSPKAGADFVVRSGNELKLVYPQPGLDPADFETLSFEQFFLQPMDGPNIELNTRLAVEYCLAHPRWRLSLQTHKLIGIP